MMFRRTMLVAFALTLMGGATGHVIDQRSYTCSFEFDLDAYEHGSKEQGP